MIGFDFEGFLVCQVFVNSWTKVYFGGFEGCLLVEFVEGMSCSDHCLLPNEGSSSIRETGFSTGLDDPETVVRELAHLFLTEDPTSVLASQARLVNVIIHYWAYQVLSPTYSGRSNLSDQY